MIPIHVELSPGSAVKSRPMLETSGVEDDYPHHRASRDSYYYNNTVGLSGKLESLPHVEVDETSAEAMLELELDAILRGEATAAARKKETLAPARKGSGQNTSYGGVRASSLDALLCTKPVKGSATAPSTRKPSPTRIDVPDLAPCRLRDETIVKAASPAPPLCDRVLIKSGRAAASTSAHSASPASSSRNTADVRRSAMQRSIDRFFDASEDSLGGRQASLPASSSSSPSTPLSPRNTLTSSSPPTPPPAVDASPSPRPPASENRGRRAGSSSTSPPSSDDLSRILFGTCTGSGSGSGGGKPVTTAAQIAQNGPKLRTTLSNDADSTIGRRTTFLRTLPMNTTQLRSKLATKQERSSSGGAAAARPASSQNTPSVDAAPTAGSVAASSPSWDGCEVSLRCDACQQFMTVFAFYAAGTLPHVRCCPLCGEGGIVLADAEGRSVV